MSNIYVDLSAGSDSTGDGSNLNPYLTINKAVAMGFDGDTIRVGKTAAPSVISTSNTTWTYNSNSISTASSHVGIINVGDYIGKTTAAGNGATETYYRVVGVSAGAITLETKYCGSTETVASFNKIVPTTTGVGGAVAATITKSMTVSGGWTLATETQDSETWMKSNNLRSLDVGGILANTTGVTITNINVVETGRLIRLMYAGCTLSYFSGGGAYVYPIEVGAINCVLTHVRCTGGYGTSYGALYVSALPVTTDLTVHLSGYVGVALPTTAVRQIFGPVTVECCTNGINVGVGNTVKDCVVSYCSTSGISGSINSKIETCTASNCTYGISLGSMSGVLVTGCILSTNTYGVYLTTSGGIIVRGCQFTSNNYDCYSDQYGMELRFENNTHVTPVVFAYSKASANSAPFYISECTIDLPSLAKAFQVIANNNYISPQYCIQNSFGGIYGSYYANGLLLRDTTTSPYSVQIQLTTSNANALSEYKVGACYAKQGIAKTINYKLKATGAWSGTIVPYLMLNDKIIVTGTAITSVSSGSWDNHTISATLGEVAVDGELALVFSYSGNTIAVNVKDFEVIDT